MKDFDNNIRRRELAVLCMVVLTALGLRQINGFSWLPSYCFCLGGRLTLYDIKFENYGKRDIYKGHCKLTTRLNPTAPFIEYLLGYS
jgi:hypothetical protein